MAVIEASDERALNAAWARIKLDSGEKVFVSITPKGVSISRMILGGALPWRAIWKSDPETAAVHFRDPEAPGVTILQSVVRVVMMAASVRDLPLRLRLTRAGKPYIRPFIRRAE